MRLAREATDSSVPDASHGRSAYRNDEIQRQEESLMKGMRNMSLSNSPFMPNDGDDTHIPRSNTHSPFNELHFDDTDPYLSQHAAQSIRSKANRHRSFNLGIPSPPLYESNETAMLHVRRGSLNSGYPSPHMEDSLMILSPRGYTENFDDLDANRRLREYETNQLSNESSIQLLTPQEQIDAMNRLRMEQRAILRMQQQNVTTPSQMSINKQLIYDDQPMGSNHSLRLNMSQLQYRPPDYHGSLSARSIGTETLSSRPLGISEYESYTPGLDSSRSATRSRSGSSERLMDLFDRPMFPPRSPDSCTNSAMGSYSARGYDTLPNSSFMNDLPMAQGQKGIHRTSSGGRPMIQAPQPQRQHNMSYPEMEEVQQQLQQQQQQLARMQLIIDQRLASPPGFDDSMVSSLS